MQFFDLLVSFPSPVATRWAAPFLGLAANQAARKLLPVRRTKDARAKSHLKRHL